MIKINGTSKYLVRCLLQSVVSLKNIDDLASSLSTYIIVFHSTSENHPNTLPNINTSFNQKIQIKATLSVTAKRQIQFRSIQTSSALTSSMNQKHINHEIQFLLQRASHCRHRGCITTHFEVNHRNPNGNKGRGSRICPRCGRTRYHGPHSRGRVAWDDEQRISQK